MTDQSQNPSPAPRRNWTNAALWCLGLGLLANAAAMVYSHSGGQFPELILDRGAFAQTPTGGLLGARGIYMMPAQLGPTAFGLYLMDIDSSTICVYRVLPEGNRFKLIAARSFKNDRFLEDLNNDSPTPKDVLDFVQKQRARTELKNQTDTPTVDQNPPENK